MLHSLAIRNFIIVDHIEITFSKGFTVFTGETGTGKSILIDALALLLGGRTDPNVIRTGQTRAEINAEFLVTPAITQWLDQYGFDSNTEEDSLPVVLIRRLIETGRENTGRSRAFINGGQATLAQLSELGAQLVNIHGQHAHQQLLSTEAQRCLLDSHAGLDDLTEAVGQSYKKWKTAQKNYQDSLQQALAESKEQERLEWELNELDQLAPEAEEWLKIKTEHHRLSHASTLIQGLESALCDLSESDQALLPTLSNLRHRLQQLSDIDPALQDILENLETADIQLQEGARALNHYLQKTEIDTERLVFLDQRMDHFHTLARRLSELPENLHTVWQTHRQKFDSIQALKNTSALQSLLETAEQEYRQKAQELSKQRAEAAVTLSQAITESMQSLSMPGGYFEIALEPTEPQAKGLEKVEFQVAAHPGVPCKPLAKIASGGELARISLAISVIMSNASLTPTLIFDEVDSGIGGAVAEVVGRLLKTLGKKRQVLCVTHLTQVAALAEQHLQVSKQSNETETLSTLSVLQDTQRVEEIARMLGGVQITETTRQHAREMLGL